MKHWIFKSLWSILVLTAGISYGYNKAPKVQLETSCQPSMDIGKVLANAQSPSFDYDTFLHRNGEDLIVEKQLNEIYISAKLRTHFKPMQLDVNGCWDTTPIYKNLGVATYLEYNLFESESTLDSYAKTYWVATNQRAV